MTELAYISAHEALERFRKRELSPVELLQAVIDRAEDVEPTVNALCQTLYEEALGQAREAEKRYSGRGASPRPLEGIPLAIKEEEAVAGQPCTQGSLIEKDFVADRSSAFAQRMLDSGAVVHARTTSPEFGSAPFTRSRLWGITRNPWNPTYAAGGSSGGSGAALASGTTTLASGSDIAGSIRIPASLNGVVGFKPPYGRVPVEPPFNLDTYLQNGPMARSVTDAILLQNVISGPDPSDITTLRPKLELPLEYRDVEGMRVALSVDFGGWPVDPEVRRNTLAVATLLRSCGATVEEVDLTLPREELHRAAAIHFAQSIGFLEDLIDRNPGITCPYLAAGLADLRRRSEGATMPEGHEIEARLWLPLAELLASFDVLVCPTVGTRGLLADDEYLGDTVLEVDGESLEHPLDFVMTLPFNIFSRCPVLAMPSGFADNGVPTGVQIVGNTYDDESVFRVGAAIERSQPGLGIPEPASAGLPT